VVAALAAACGGGEAPGPWQEAEGYRWRELHPASGRAGFTEMQGDRSGIVFANDVSDELLEGNRMLAQGAGIALGDVDGDGRTDLFLARTQGCSALYRNLGDWRFEEVTASAGVGACDRHTTGAALLDLDGDKDLDLALLATTGPNAIFVNDGAGRFTERRDLGLDSTGRGGTTLTAADVDGDGWLDLYVANYKAYTIDDSIPPQRRAFNQMVREVSKGRFVIVPEHAREYKVVDRPDVGGVRMTQRAAPDAYYRNVNGRLVAAPIIGPRFLDASGAPLREAPESFALGAKFRDLDADGDPDLYVANDFEDLDVLWLNDGKGGFRMADWTALRQMSNSSMGVDIADVDGNGTPEIFVTDMRADDSRRLRTQIPTHTALPKLPGDDHLQLQQQRNVLFVNRGDGTFAEAAMEAGVAASGWSWGTMFLDVDLDGWKDLLVANGHLWDIMDADVQESLLSRQNEVSWRRVRWQFPPLRLRNLAFRNRGDLTFEPMGESWRFGTEEDVSHAIASGDLDDDGDLDVIVNRLRSPALVLRNDAPAPRVSVRLVGDAPNTRAVGARLRFESGAAPVQEHEVTVGGLYLSHSDDLASFALAATDSATLTVEWRDGRRTTIPGVRANRHYEITTATARATAASNAPGTAATATAANASSATPAPADPAPLFEDATAELGGHAHAEPRYDDWQRQFLLPNALSQLGPGVAWFDSDRDGDEDLFVGAGKGGRIGQFRNDGRRLTPQPLAATTSADLTTVLGRANGTSGELLAGVSSWERDTVPDVVSVALGRDPSLRARVAATGASTGPMALGDVDGDGSLDLFVGARVIPLSYPAPATSMLYRAVGDDFVPDEANRAVLRDIGLVSAAMFADMNGDGRADLLLALEWGPPVLLLNEDGRLVRAGAETGLDRWTSRWIGIATGDFDGDGRLDIVATSWGRNTMTGADSARPLVLFHGPIGARGEEEPFLARHDPRVGGIAPLNSYARVRIVLPDLVGRINSFGAYADATMDRVLGAQLGRTRRVDAVTLDQTLFLNRGGRFDAVPLPSEAQRAPASYAGIADFDGDGNEDVVLSQNFFPTVVGEPRYDAGRGLLLLGDGRGGLTPQPGARSGIAVYGDQRGAAYADADGDGRLDLVITQNAGLTRFYRNRGARPGIRVRLEGPAVNPDAVGAQVRLVFGERRGPVREVQAGSGYWSQNGAVQVFGAPQAPTAVWVRWPGGKETVTPVSAGAREVRVRP
jgi:hypothetical protein